MWPEGFDDGTYTYCTGTLISSTVFLTAAHCDAWTDDGVTFDAEYDPETSELYSICAGRRCADDPKYDAQWHAHRSIDIAVVEFNEPPIPPGITPADLPTRNQFNTVAKDQQFTAVGYGAAKSDSQSGGPSSIVYGDQRRYGVSTFKSVNRDYLRLSQNQGSGGTCYGDSGGPNFFGVYDDTIGGYDYNADRKPDVPVIASTTITGDTWCKATNVTLRLDTDPVRAFLDDYVTLP